MFVFKFNSPETFTKTYLMAEQNHPWLNKKFYLATVTNQENILVLAQLHSKP